MDQRGNEKIRKLYYWPLNKFQFQRYTMIRDIADERKELFYEKDIIKGRF
jgi:hypothetical protein